jgi:uncharacterized protein (TIGR03503 family)
MITKVLGRMAAVITIWLGCSLAAAQVVPDEQELAEAVKASDVRVVIDVSGSMKLNDPNNLRRPALELMLQLLPDDSKAGVWTFGRYINMLVPHRPATENWREDAKAKAEQVNSVGLFTNIGGALEKAAYDADRASPDYRTSIILLTDGMVDIDKDSAANQREWRRIVDEVLPKLVDAGYTVHTIALSDNADTALMDKLALATDGISAVAHSAEDLMKIFLQAFDQAAPSEQLPLRENKFLVDSSIEEFTALIFRSSDLEPTRLISPDQTEYRFDREDADVNWYKTDTYDLITVQKPLEGEWQVLADMDPDSRVSIVSNLKMLVKPLPSNLFKDDVAQLSLLLQERGNTITDSSFLNLLEVNGNVAHQQSGQQWGKSLGAMGAPDNGIYSTELDHFQQEGRYDVSVVVDGKSFQRQFSQPIIVREPFAISLDKLVNDGREQRLLSVRSHSQLVNSQQTQIVARIKDPKGRTAIKPLQITATEDWQLWITPEHEGEYNIRVRISGTDNEGNRFELDPEPLSFRFPDSDDPFASAEPVPAEPQPEPVVEPEPQVVAEEPEIIEEPAPEAELPAEEPVEEESSNWLLYTGLGVGNIIIMALAFFAYRMVMGSGKGDSLSDLEKAVEDVEAEAEESSAEVVAEVAAAPEPEPEKKPAPIEMSFEEDDDSLDSSLDDLAMDDSIEESIGEEPVSEEALADELSAEDEGLDLSDDSVAEADIPAVDNDDSSSEDDDLMADLDELDLGEIDDSDDGDDLMSMEDFDDAMLDDLKDDQDKKG